MYSYRIKTPQSKPPIDFSIRPFLVGMALIFLVTSFFFYKNKQKERSLELKKEQLLQKAQETEQVEVDLISPKEVFRAINNKKFQLIDIRKIEEFQLKHIESSLNLPLSSLEENIDLINKKLKVVIIDREDSPYGRILTDHLKNQGVEAKYLEGGILNFSNEGYPLVTTGSPINTQDLMKVTSVTTDQLLEMIYAGERIALIDTREASSFEQQHIEGSINIPLEEMEKRKNELPTKNLLLYDADALRSFQAAVRLYDMGFLQVYNCLDDYETLSRRLQEETEKKKQQPIETPQE